MKRLFYYIHDKYIIKRIEENVNKNSVRRVKFKFKIKENLIQIFYNFIEEEKELKKYQYLLSLPRYELITSEIYNICYIINEEIKIKLDH